MKFSQLPAKNAEAIAGFYIKVAEICATESQQLSQEGLRLLVLGNGAGVAILATFLGVIIERKEPINDLLVPLVIFLVGATLAAFAYVPLIGVASNTAKHIGESFEKIFKDELELEQLQGWGFTKGGSIFVTMLFLFSILCFVSGVVVCIFVLLGRG